MLTALLVFSRMGGLLMSMPVFKTRGVPKHMQVLAAVALTAVLAPVVPAASLEGGLIGLLFSSASEVGVGLLMGFIVTVIFEAMHLATELMSTQSGFAMASIFNPFSKASSAPLGNLAGWMTALVFLTTGLHRDCLLMLGKSFEVLPAGTLAQPGRAGEVVIEVTTQMIVLGAQLAGPVVALVWLLNVFVAVLTRLAPRMNVYFSVGLVLTPISAVMLFGISLPWLLLAHNEAIADSLNAAMSAVHALAGG